MGNKGSKAKKGGEAKKGDDLKLPTAGGLDIIPEGRGLSPHADLWQLAVPKKDIAKVIGKGGSTKTGIEKKHGLRIDILGDSREKGASSPQTKTKKVIPNEEALVLVRHQVHAEDHCCSGVTDILSHLYSDDVVTVQMPLPTEALLDQAGAMIIAEEIVKLCDVKMKIFRQNLGPIYGEVAICQVHGKVHPCRLAALMVGRDILGCGALTVNCEQFVVRKSNTGSLIGKGGQNMKDIRSMCPDLDFDIPRPEEGDSNCTLFGSHDDIEKVKKLVTSHLDGKQVVTFKSPQLHIPDNKTRESWYGESNHMAVNGKLDPKVTKKSVRATIRDKASHHVMFPEIISGIEAGNGNASDILAMRYVSADRVSELKDAIYGHVISEKMSGKAACDFLRPLLDAVAQIESGSQLAESIFFRPDEDDEVQRLLAHLDRAQKSISVALFSITFNPLAEALKDAAGRGCLVRIISDDDQACQTGSDIDHLQKAGIQVKVDGLPFHMHHKFAVIDETVLITGSFNWTKSAVENNCENVAITSDHRLIPNYIDGFQAMWDEFPDFDKDTVVATYRQRMGGEARNSGEVQVTKSLDVKDIKINEGKSKAKKTRG